MEHKITKSSAKGYSDKRRAVASWLYRLPSAGVGVAIDYQQSYGLNYSDAKAMALLYSAPMGPCQLAEKLDMSPAGITKLVDRLEQKGLVNRRRHPADRRRSLVFITDKALVSGVRRHRIEGLINQAVYHATNFQLDALYEFFQDLGRQMVNEGLIKR